MATLRVGLDLRLYGHKDSGLGRYGQHVLESLLTLGDHISVAAIVSNENVAAELASRGVRIIVAPARPYTWREQRVLPQVIRELGVDLMHFPHFNVPLACPVPYIVTIHDLILHHYPTRRASQLPAIFYWIKYVGYRLLLRRVLHHSATVIAISDFTAEDLLTYYPWLARRLFVIKQSVPDLTALSVGSLPVRSQAKEGTQSVNKFENLVLPNDLPAAKSDLCADNISVVAYTTNSPFALVVGNFYPHKNITVLLEAWAQVAQTLPYQLVLVGRDDFFRRRVEERARALGLMKGRRPAVIFTGQVDDVELHRLYKEASVLLFPSRYEGAGLPALEALANGCPVIASPESVLPETMGQAAIYVPVVTAQPLATALLKLLPHLTTGRHLPPPRPTPNEVGSMLLNIYKQTLSA